MGSAREGDSVSHNIGPAFLDGTDMGGSDADIEPAVSIAGMRKVIAGVTKNSNGRFYDYSGKELTW